MAGNACEWFVPITDNFVSMSILQITLFTGIRTVQSILLKIALVLGVKVHFPVTFIDYIEPQSINDGWHIKLEPNISSLSQRSYDAILCADGKQQSLKSFKSKEFRAKLAIAITANFVNRNTNEEAAVEEISGVSYIYNQSFFKSLSHQYGIELENIVYYKDETHYFVMTAKKSSLLSKGVLKKVSLCLIYNMNISLQLFLFSRIMLILVSYYLEAILVKQH